MNWLLIVIIVNQSFHVSFNLHFLFLDIVIYDCSHPSEICIDVSSFLALYVLCSINEIILLFKFVPKLLTPFCKDPQNSRTLYDHMLADDLSLRVLSHVFRYFSSYNPRCISLYSWSVFLILNLFIEILFGIVCSRE